MKVTDFLQGREVERQAVTRYINRHEELFAGHIKKVGKEIELDADAVAVLEKVYPLPAPVEVVEDKESREQLIQTQKLVIQLQQKLVDLQAEQTRYAQIEAQAHATALLLEDKEKLIDELKARETAKESELEALRDALEAERRKTWWEKLRGK